MREINFGKTKKRKASELNDSLALVSSGYKGDGSFNYDVKDQREFEIFKRLHHSFLADLACRSVDIAHGIINQIDVVDDDKYSSRYGLKAILRKRSKENKYDSMQELTLRDRRKLRE